MMMASRSDQSCDHARNRWLPSAFMPLIKPLGSVDGRIMADAIHWLKDKYFPADCSRGSIIEEVDEMVPSRCIMEKMIPHSGLMSGYKLVYHLLWNRFETGITYWQYIFSRELQGEYNHKNDPSMTTWSKHFLTSVVDNQTKLENLFPKLSRKESQGSQSGVAKIRHARNL